MKRTSHGRLKLLQCFVKSRQKRLRVLVRADESRFVVFQYLGFSNRSRLDEPLAVQLKCGGAQMLAKLRSAVFNDLQLDVT